MKINRNAVTAFLTAVIVIASPGSAQEALKAQNATFKSLLSGQNRRPHHLCSTAEASDPEAIRKAIENTRRTKPEIYAQMVKAQLEKSSDAEKVYVVGEKRSFFTRNFGTDLYETIGAELRASGTVADIWVDTVELKNSHITDAEVQALLKGLEISTPRASKDSTKGIIKIDSQFLGSAPNINSSGVKGAGNGRVLFLVCDIKDSFNPPADNNYIAGYFSANDQQVGNLGSNKQDMLYIDSYPGIYYGDLTDVQDALQTMAHEYQHLVHFNYDPQEQTFVNEGFSMYAEILCGYGISDLTDYLTNTNVSLFNWTQQNADYARAQLWTLYLVEQGGDGVAGKIIQSASHGIAGINQGFTDVGSPLRFDDLLNSWAIANYLNDRTVDARYGYKYGFDDRSSPIYTHSNPNQSVGYTYISTLSARYVLFLSADLLNVTFAASPGVLVKAIEIGGSGGSQVVNVPVGSQFGVSVFTPKVIFVIINTNQSGGTGSFSYSSSGVQRETFEEIAYDDGTPRVVFQNVNFLTNPGAGRGWAVKFRPSSAQNRLATARFLVSFDQEFSGSLIPQDAPKRFLLHVWRAQNENTPGTDIIPPVLVTSHRWDYTGNFLDVDLTSYAQQLTDLQSPIFLGFIEDDQYPTAVGMNNKTSGNYTYLYGAGGNPLWYAMSLLSIGSPPVSLVGWNGMIRAVFAYRTTTGVEEHVETTPENFELSQNYPNPFNPVTTVNYSLRLPSYVSLRVYDMLGREVKTLMNDRQPAGRHEVLWNGTNDAGVNLASGVYLYRMVASPADGKGGDFVDTKRLIMLK
jgi:hypothetical protein